MPGVTKKWYDFDFAINTVFSCFFALGGSRSTSRNEARVREGQTNVASKVALV